MGGLSEITMSSGSQPAHAALHLGSHFDNLVNILGQVREGDFLLPEPLLPSSAIHRSEQPRPPEELDGIKDMYIQDICISKHLRGWVFNKVWMIWNMERF